MLDLEWWQFKCCLSGHQLASYDQFSLAIYTGYYAGYYTRETKGRKKDPDHFLKSANPEKNEVVKPTPEQVKNKFLEAERRWKENARR